ncbi:hypothetical protein E3G68_005022 [Mycobacteroides abscessus]|nr:hypothetical protein [Mycobacteroides abscessus]
MLCGLRFRDYRIAFARASPFALTLRILLCINPFHYPRCRDFVAIQYLYSTVYFVTPPGFAGLIINTANTFHVSALLNQ